jgi:hypothetical protein
MTPGAGPPSNTLKKNSDSQKRVLGISPQNHFLKIKKKKELARNCKF